MANLTGQSIGRYHILEQLGEGGMAIVYKAYDTRLEAHVAIKVIRTEQFTPAILTVALKRFEREAKALARLTHPNIVKVSDYGEYDGQPYLVMPYLPGGNLKTMLKERGRLPWQEAARLLIPIARALDYAHRQGMIHRDVKPSNILITEDGEPMLTDFGIAKIIDEEVTADLTGTSATVGTPEYMAPEQVLSKSVDFRADIYALGVVFYEMVIGRKPFEADTPMAVLFKHASEPLPRPKHLLPDLPDSVEQILVKALAKKPEDRYADMALFAGALENLLAVQGTIASPPTFQKTASPASRQEFTPSTPWPSEAAAVPPTPGKKAAWLPWVIGGGIMLALGCLVTAVLMIVGWVTTPLFIPTETAAPAGTESASASALLFFDDFSNPASGWPSDRSGGDIMDYSGGSYRIYVSNAWSDLIAVASRSFPADVVIEVDATRAGGSENNDFGVLCRVQDLDNFYFFQISSDGYVVIGKFVNNEMQYLSADGMEKVEGIYASATNHIRAECIGSLLKLYANGHLVAQATDSTFTAGGDAGLMAGAFDQGGVDILFDNFKVTAP